MSFGPFKPTSADYEALVQRVIEANRTSPYWGLDYHARKAAIDSGLGGWRQLAQDAKERLEDNDAA